MKNSTFYNIKSDLLRLSHVVEKMESLFDKFPIITTLRVAIRNVSYSSEREDLYKLQDLVATLSEYNPNFHLITWIKDEIVMSIQGHSMCEEYEDEVFSDIISN
jgi:hypothetical protein